jgi:hypothetical protein
VLKSVLEMGSKLSTELLSLSDSEYTLPGFWTRNMSSADRAMEFSKSFSSDDLAKAEVPCRVCGLGILYGAPEV